MKISFWLRLLAAATTFLLLPLVSLAQNACMFSDDFSNPSGWHLILFNHTQLKKT